MKKVLFILIVILGVLAAWGAGAWARLRDAEDDVLESWRTVESNCMRRVDLIPGLIACVRDYPALDSLSFDGLMKAREAAASFVPEDLSQENLDAFRKVQYGLDAEIDRFRSLISPYEELRESAAFRSLDGMLSDCHDKIVEACGVYDIAADRYGQTAASFPANILMKIFDREPAGQFSDD